MKNVKDMKKSLEFFFMIFIFFMPFMFSSRSVLVYVRLLTH